MFLSFCHQKNSSLLGCFQRDSHCFKDRHTGKRTAQKGHASLETYLLGELLHLTLLHVLDAFILAALLGEQVVLELEHVLVSLDHLGVVVLGSLVLKIVLETEGQGLVHVGEGLVVANGERDEG